MRRDTVCRSMYSDMSKRRNCTPSDLGQLLGQLGLADAGRPGEDEAPIGRCGSPRPARFILIACATRSTAVSWP